MSIVLTLIWAGGIYVYPETFSSYQACREAAVALYEHTMVLDKDVPHRWFCLPESK